MMMMGSMIVMRMTIDDFHNDRFQFFNYDRFQVCDGIVRSKLPLFDQALSFHYYCYFMIIIINLIRSWFILLIMIIIDFDK